MLSVATLMAVVLSQGPLAAERLELVAAPGWGPEVGVRNLASARGLLLSWHAALGEEDDPELLSVPRGLLSISGRALAVGLIDAPLVATLGVVAHEVFGHGARARAQGDWPTYAFSLPLPYRWVFDGTTTFNGVTFSSRDRTRDEELLFTTGGLDTNAAQAHFGALVALRDGGRHHFGAALESVITRLAYVQRWVDPTTLGAGSADGDLDALATGLLARFGREGDGARQDLDLRLRLAALWMLADPMLWLSAKEVVVDHIGRGRRWNTLPQLKLGALRLLPVARFTVTPFGAEHWLDVIVSGERWTLDGYVRVVSSGLAPAVGTGARLFRFSVLPSLEVGGALDVWLQPELLSAQPELLRPGVSAQLEATWFPFGPVGLVVQLGAKSRGLVMGGPAREGFFGFGGLVFRPEVTTTR